MYLKKYKHYINKNFKKTIDPLNFNNNININASNNNITNPNN
jgi:hypothetical protein